MNYKNLLKEAETIVTAPTSSALVEALTGVFSDSYVLYFKAHSFHWNVVGKDFPQYHDFFEKFYSFVYGNIDSTAEHIRTLGAPAPMSLISVVGKSQVTENSSTLSAMEMISMLAKDNEKVLVGLLSCQKMAEAANEVGLANYLQDLYDNHKKFAWMFKATLQG